MPTIKIKAPQNNVRKGSASGKPKAAATSRKKRRVTSDDEDEDDYSTRKSEEGIDEEEDYSAQGPSTSKQTRQRRRLSMSRTQAQGPDAENLFEDELNVDILSSTSPPPPDSDDLPDRAPTPLSAPPRRRSGKKRTVPVFSDEDDEYVDSGRKLDDKDDDFIVDSPPRRSGKKGGVGPGRGRGRGAKDKGGIGEIHIKDERKFPPSGAAVPPGGAEVRVGPGAKRRRETVSDANVEAVPSTTYAAPPAADATGVSQSSSTNQEGSGAAAGTSTTVAPPSKIRKLPPIKKNKALAGGATSTAPSSGPSTPSASASAATKTGAASNTANSLPIHTSLPRKPPLTKTSDVDLTSPDIYNSLFKTGSAAPRVGVNSRIKEEERRKELMKMRDEARAARMANLQKNSFDLLAAQTKVGRFESKLRARNSPALYPNHLGSALKLIVMKRIERGLQRPPGPVELSRNSGPEASGTTGGR